MFLSFARLLRVEKPEKLARPGRPGRPGGCCSAEPLPCSNMLSSCLGSGSPRTVVALGMTVGVTMEKNSWLPASNRIHPWWAAPALLFWRHLLATPREDRRAVEQCCDLVQCTLVENWQNERVALVSGLIPGNCFLEVLVDYHLGQWRQLYCRFGHHQFCLQDSKAGENEICKYLVVRSMSIKMLFKNKTPPREPVPEPERPLLIILSSVCKFDRKEAHCTSTNPLFNKNVHGQEHHRDMCECRNSILNINHVKHILNVNIRCRTTSVRKRQSTIGYPFPHQLEI